MRLIDQRAVWALILALAASVTPAADRVVTSDGGKVALRWGVKIPLRDGVRLNATAYLPRSQTAPAPCIVTLTPYTSHRYHEPGVYFAARGYPFLVADVRGRGNSEGEFRPVIQEAHDGYDVIEWLARQPWCNGKVAMWGGSYAGYGQWAAAKEFPPHLASIAPAASAFAGVDFPMRNNIAYPYQVQWLTLVNGRTPQDGVFGDRQLWSETYRRWFESGISSAEIGGILGPLYGVFEQWGTHPHQDAYWDACNPTAEQYARLAIPILTITGVYDGDQPGALTHYREHMRNASPEGRARHYLVIGPWDHAGTRTPKTEVGGVRFGPAALLDLPKLHLEWYAWTMQGGPKPEFLRKPVAYYVAGQEQWRYADTLEGVTGESHAYYLGSTGNPTDVLHSGSLTREPRAGAPDRYVYDPRDTGRAELESRLDPDSLTDQQLIYARSGRQLVYHSAPLERDTEISGFFRLTAWIGIDQPDTDFSATVHEIGPDGSSVLLTRDLLRARYRESFRAPKLITTRAPLRYDFTHFTFVSRQVRKGSRLRLVISPLDSIYWQKNHNSGREVSAETGEDARSVTVRLYHDRSHPSALHVPIGAQPD